MPEGLVLARYTSNTCSAAVRASTSTNAGAGIEHFVDGEMGVTKAELRNKKAGDSFTGEIDIGITKAEQGNDETSGSFTSQMGITNADQVGAAGKGVVTEEDWIDFVFPITPVELLERKKAEPKGTLLITKEMVPDVIIDRLKMKRPFRKLPPINDNISDVYIIFPELRNSYLSTMARWNYLVDLHVDVLRQDAEKGFAEIGIDFTDGVKKIFILPQPQPQVMIVQQRGNDGSGGGSSKTMLVVIGFAIMFALLVVLFLVCSSKVR